LNGDGYDDIIGSDNVNSFWDGIACLWLGGPHFNGTCDLIIPAPQLGRQFGWSKATGDFNNDGLCDVAISAPCWDGNTPLTPGRVYVYSGNTDLHDTTVANDDPVTPPPTKLWAIRIFPNPLSGGKVNLNVSFVGMGYKSLQNAGLLISNLKGERVYQCPLPGKTLRAGTWSNKINHLSKGVYLVSVQTQGKALITKKISVTQ